MQLANDRAHQILDALLFESHRLGNLLVRKALGDQARHFVFASRKLETVGGHTGSSPSTCYGADQVGAKRLRFLEQRASRLVAGHALIETWGKGMLAICDQNGSELAEGLSSEKKLDVVIRGAAQIENEEVGLFLTCRSNALSLIGAGGDHMKPAPGEEADEAIEEKPF